MFCCCCCYCYLEPELILISCGFDAGDGDFIRGYDVSLACYAHMTRQLMGMTNGKVALALEGGSYNETKLGNILYGQVILEGSFFNDST